MALNKVTYTDDVTVIGAQNLNNIQDEIISLETVDLVAVNSDLDTIQTPGRYRLWGEYTNAPKTGNVYGILTVEGVSGALIQTYQSATATDSYFRGYTNSQWYPWKQFMLSNGGIFSGTLYIDRKDGTTSATGTSTLWVGNNTPTGTAGNSKGQVVLYGNGANYINIQATNATGNRTVELPNANGNIALEEQLDSNSNGAYVKFPGGLLIQWATKVTAIQAGVQKTITETFPMAFVGTSITAFVNPLTSSATIRTSVVGYTTTTMNIAIYDSAVASNERYYNWVAFGKWK